MMNPTGDEFNEEVPTSASADVGAFQTSNRGMSGTASNAWEQTKEKAGAARERTEVFVRRNLGALSRRDRKSTRLNSSHRTISYAVFCLTKKKYDLAIHDIKAVDGMALLTQT